MVMPFWKIFLEKATTGTPSGVPGTEGTVSPRTASGRCRERSFIWRSAMALNLSQKQEVVAELAEVAAKAHSLIAAEYAGTTVSQMTAMRKKARETGVYLRVVKNTLASRAVAGTEFEVVKDSLVGPLLYAFSTEEPGAAGRLIKEFAKGNDKLQAKVVAMSGKLMKGSDLDRLASLPTRDQAISMFLALLKEPASRVARVFKAIGDQKEQAA